MRCQRACTIYFLPSVTEAATPSPLMHTLPRPKGERICRSLDRLPNAGDFAALSKVLFEQFVRHGADCAARVRHSVRSCIRTYVSNMDCVFGLAGSRSVFQNLTSRAQQICKSRIRRQGWKTLLDPGKTRRIHMLTIVEWHERLEVRTRAAQSAPMTGQTAPNNNLAQRCEVASIRVNDRRERQIRSPL